MKIQTSIEEKLIAAFKPQHLEVLNESYMHNVPAGSESHFKVVIVTAEFEGQRLVSRHRAINQLLSSELANDIHALALHTYSQKEWNNLHGISPDSPKCLGGNLA